MLGCNNQFSSQTRMIQEEILAMMLQNTILSEEPHFKEDFDKEVFVIMIYMSLRLCSVVISMELLTFLIFSNTGTNA